MASFKVEGLGPQSSSEVQGVEGRGSDSEVEGRGSDDEVEGLGLLSVRCKRRQRPQLLYTPRKY